MGLLKGRLSARRFVVNDSLPQNWREVYRDNLDSMAFTEPVAPTLAEVSGWVHIHDELKTDFEDFNGWLLGSYLSLGFRIDKRTIPAAKLKAELKKRVKLWCEDRDLERCPKETRKDIKEQIQDEWTARVIPKTKVIELIWNIDSNIVYLSSHSDADCDKVRVQFYRTFGRRLLPMMPTEWVRTSLGEDAVDALVC